MTNDEGLLKNLTEAYRQLWNIPLRTFGPVSFRWGHLVILMLWIVALLVWGLVSIFTVGSWMLLPRYINLAFLATAIFVAVRGDQAAERSISVFLEKTSLDPPVLMKRFVTGKSAKAGGNWLSRHLFYLLVGVAVGILLVLNLEVKTMTFNEAYLLVTGGDIGRKSLYVAFIELLGYTLAEVPSNPLWQRSFFLTILVLEVGEWVWFTRWLMRETKIFRYVALAIFAISLLQSIAWFVPYACPWPYSIFGSCPT